LYHLNKNGPLRGGAGRTPLGGALGRISPGEESAVGALAWGEALEGDPPLANLQEIGFSRQRQYTGNPPDQDHGRGV